VPTLAEKVDPKSAGLVIIDWQNDFCYRNAAAGPGGDLQPLDGVEEATANINRLVAAAHAVDLPVFFVATTHGPDVDSEVWTERSRDRTKFRPAPDTWGAEFHGISPGPSDEVVIKHRWSAFIRTELEERLQARGIKSIIVCGVSANGCVEKTSLDGYMLDYYIVAARDCMATSHPDNRTMEQTFPFGVVATTDELIALWSQVPAKA
jgi:ureidoacrylate peracid hydrolase